MLAGGYVATRYAAYDELMPAAKRVTMPLRYFTMALVCYYAAVAATVRLRTYAARGGYY